MKQLLLAVFGFTALHLQAAIWSVNNEPGAAADYAALSSAIMAANNGDTILLYPGITSYGNAAVSKQLFILGPGHSVEYTGLVPTIGSLTLYSGASGLVVKGVRIDQITSISGATANNVVISGCRLAAINVLNFNPSTLNGWIFEGNVVLSQTNGLNFGSTVSQNWTIRNNIFQNAPSNGQWISYAQNHVFDHNVFIQTGSSTGNSICGPDCSNLAFTNNVILYTITSPLANTVGTCPNCSFESNITYATGSTVADLPGNNLNNTDPQFANVPFANPNFDYAHDHNLQEVSPGHNAATDGTDIGVYGGAHAFRIKGFSNTMPRIGNVTPINDNAPPGGTMQFNLKAFSAGN